MKRYVWAAALRPPLFVALVLCAGSHAAFAQSVPSPWTAIDIGAPALSGSATHSSGVFTIHGAGTDLNGTSDQFYFVYQQVSGDVDIVARVDDLVASSAYAKAGVMIRASLTASSPHAFSHVSERAGVRFLRRRTASGTTYATSGPAVSAPVWVRAVRQGTRVAAYSSTNGTSWTTIGSDTIELGTTAYVGIAVNSRKASERATSKVSNVTVSKEGGALPSGQQNMDIGSPALQGSASYASGAYIVKAAGIDIWDTSDQFHFVYQPVTGNVEVVARVAAIGNTDRWSKAGVMIRESLTAQSRQAMVITSISKGYAFQRRPEPGGYTEHTPGGPGSAPGWVRLVRTGDLFEAYRSSTGTSWTKIGADTIPMGDTVYVGIAATSHNAAALATDVIDNFRVRASTSTNNPPAVSITAPATGTTVTAPATVTVTAMATDPENRMASVDFYSGSTMISRATTAPYSVSWAASTVGTYALTAVAHDADGGSSTSSAVKVTVQSATNQPPTISLATSGTSFTAPATIAMTATASDPEGKMARVEFFNGSTLLYTDTTAPHSYSWSNVAAGSYSLRAVAYDTSGASATSSTIVVTVGTVTTTPPTSIVFTASVDHATTVTKYVLRIYAAVANPATATPVATSDLGKPTPSSSGDITVNREAFFSALAVGSYQAAVSSVGSGGESQSGAVAFTR
jgi:regulation of enolase protein 1 (concanavalin A-like superfamily)